LACIEAKCIPFGLIVKIVPGSNAGAMTFSSICGAASAVVVIARSKTGNVFMLSFLHRLIQLRQHRVGQTSGCLTSSGPVNCSAALAAVPARAATLAIKYNAQVLM
jgi:hypothetical protein